MGLSELLQQIPEWRRMKERDAFETFSGPIQLASWTNLNAARWWCEERWQERDLKYRWRIYVDERRAFFEFPDKESYTAFALRFG